VWVLVLVPLIPNKQIPSLEIVDEHGVGVLEEQATDQRNVIGERPV
jgi:hypothetical protein